MHSELHILEKSALFPTSNATQPFRGILSDSFVSNLTNYENMESLDNFIDNKRIEKSLSLLTRKFVELLLASKNGILDLKVVSNQIVSILFMCRVSAISGRCIVFPLFSISMRGLFWSGAISS